MNQSIIIISPSLPAANIIKHLIEHQT